MKYSAQNEADIKAKDIDGFDALEFALNIKKQDAWKILIYQQINIFSVWIKPDCSK